MARHSTIEERPRGDLKEISKRVCETEKATHTGIKLLDPEDDDLDWVAAAQSIREARQQGPPEAEREVRSPAGAVALNGQDHHDATHIQLGSGSPGRQHQVETPARAMVAAPPAAPEEPLTPGQSSCLTELTLDERNRFEAMSPGRQRQLMAPHRDGLNQVMVSALRIELRDRPQRSPSTESVVGDGPDRERAIRGVSNAPERTATAAGRDGPVQEGGQGPEPPMDDGGGGSRAGPSARPNDLEGRCQDELSGRA